MTGNMQTVIDRMRAIENRFAVKMTKVPGGEQIADFAKVLSAATSGYKPNGDAIVQEIERAAAAHGLDAALVKAVAKAESDNDPSAVSAAGAQGVMQLMPETSAELGVGNPLNPVENINGGVRYLRGLLDKFGGNIPLALAAYNAGPGNVEQYGGIPPFKETQQYVAKALEYYRQFK